MPYSQFDVLLTGLQNSPRPHMGDGGTLVKPWLQGCKPGLQRDTYLRTRLFFYKQGGVSCYPIARGAGAMNRL